MDDALRCDHLIKAIAIRSCGAACFAVQRGCKFKPVSEIIVRDNLDVWKLLSSSFSVCVYK